MVKSILRKNPLINLVIKNYFLLMTINAIIIMAIFEGGARLNYVLSYSAIFMAFVKFVKFGLSKLDLFILFFVISLIIQSLFNNYPRELLIVGIEQQIIPISFFFLGESSWFSDDDFFKRGFKIIIFIGIFGVFLFVYQPEWYLAFKVNTTGFDDTEGSIAYYELTRLSSFWGASYFVSYSTTVFLHYKVCCLIREPGTRLIDMATILFLLSVIILTQQRVSIIFSLLSFSCYIYLKYLRSFSLAKLKQLMLCLLVITLLIGYVAQNIDDTRSAYIEKRIDEMIGNDGDSFMDKRADLFSDFYSKEITLFGDGLGIYSHRALLKYNKPSITDQQYLKTIYETGIWGCMGYLIIFSLTFFRGLRFVKYYIFELGVLLYFLASMMGACSLSTYDQHPFLLWLCCGRIFNKRYFLIRSKYNE